ncbi:MAG: membrane protein insertion efficiency factor YidD [Pseudomonadota bacterium]|nr:membrane protein insertion efficiency factor YidD [Pseudomonadota bacterium]
MLQSASLALIGLYQRRVSPRKGYVCALRAQSGGRSCSRYAARAIVRAGIWSGALLLRRRLRAGADAAAAFAAAAVLAEEAARDGPGGAAAPSFEDRTFGSCAPAVREGRKLCCGSLVGGILNNSGR